MSDDTTLIAGIALYRDADHIDVFAIADALEERGYAVDFLTDPQEDESHFYVERGGAVKTGISESDDDE